MVAAVAHEQVGAKQDNAGQRFVCLYWKITCDQHRIPCGWHAKKHARMKCSNNGPSCVWLVAAEVWFFPVFGVLRRGNIFLVLFLSSLLFLLLCFSLFISICAFCIVVLLSYVNVRAPFGAHCVSHPTCFRPVTMWMVNDHLRGQFLASS